MSHFVDIQCLKMVSVFEQRMIQFILLKYSPFRFWMFWLYVLHIRAEEIDFYQSSSFSYPVTALKLLYHDYLCIKEATKY